MVNKKDKLMLLISYIHNIKACEKHKHHLVISLFPSVIGIEYKGFYENKVDKIDKILNSYTKEEIIQIISLNHFNKIKNPINLLTLKKILGYSYATIHQHIHELVDARILKLVKGTGKKGKKEAQIMFDDNVNVVILSNNKELKSRLIKEMKDSEKEMSLFSNWLENEIKKEGKKPTIKKSARV